MEGFFGIGIPEILLILVLAFLAIILGPQDMVSTARKLGRWVYRAYHSPIWRQIMSTSAELRELPTKFVREAGLEDTIDDLKKTQADVKAQLKEATDGVSSELKAAQKEASLEVQAAANQATTELKEAAVDNKTDAVQPSPAVIQPDPAAVPSESAVIQPDPALVQAETQPSSNGSDHTPPAPLPYHPPEPPSDLPADPPDEYSI